MRSFVKWYGEVPAEARPIEDSDAQEHAAAWIRRNIGVGIAFAYVIGFQSGTCWWTLFFDRSDRAAPAQAERWKVESYSNAARSWTGEFDYWPGSKFWRRADPGAVAG